MEHTIDIKAKNVKYFSIAVLSGLVITFLSYFLPIFRFSIVLFLLTLFCTIAGLFMVKNMKLVHNINLTPRQINDLKTASILLWITLGIILLIFIAIIGLIVLIGTYGFGR